MRARVVFCALVTVILSPGWGCGDDDSGDNNNVNSNENENSSPTCGDGNLDPEEQCDDGAANSDTAPDACRTDCRLAYCGDGVQDSTERCDTDELGGAGCAEVGDFDGGELSCSDQCDYDTSACTLCGDGLVEGQEQCDGSNMAGATCGSVNAGQHGLLACSSACEYDTAGCHTCGDGVLEPAEECEDALLPTCAEDGYLGGTRTCIQCELSGACQAICGNGIIEPGEQCDGGALDGQSCQSQGFHGGQLRCSPSCRFNTGGCSSCGDGVIDTADGETCDGSNLAGLDCAAALGTGYTGTPECTSACQPDLSVCVASTGCGDGVADASTGEECDGADLGATTTCALLDPNRYAGGSLGCLGNCTYDTSSCVAINPCGNGVLEPSLGEACDGADLGGTTCADLGFPGGTLSCQASCTYDVSSCDPPASCGDGVIDSGEPCDGAELGGQTCASLGYESGSLSCTAQCTLDLSACERCGNGLVETGEQCDDGADNGRYGHCLADCSGPGPYCGDGTTDSPDEACDDGNTDDTDGCLSTCEAASCGDGHVWSGHEACDDGNTTSGDGCDQCAEESGWSCQGAPSTCITNCGDGIAAGAEECDGQDLGGHTCTGMGMGFDGGELSCAANCMVDTQNCTICGDGVCDIPHETPSNCAVECSVTMVRNNRVSSCVLLADTSVWCWGFVGLQYLNGPIPNRILGPGGSGYLSGISDMLGADNAFCGVHGSGSVYCWGYNTYGQVGNGNTQYEHYPTEVLGVGGVGTLSNVLHADGGSHHVCAVSNAGSAFCWGDGNLGSLGSGMWDDSYTPVQVVGDYGVGFLTGVDYVRSGGRFSCARMLDTSVRCWGLNNGGCLGDGTFNNSNIPVSPLNPGSGGGILTGVDELDVGGAHVCAVRSGEVWCWGHNGNGQIGNNSGLSNFSVPTQVFGPGCAGYLSGIRSVSLGSNFSCATSYFGAVYCWGQNTYGMMGDGTVDDAHCPVQVVGAGGSGTLSDVVSLASADWHSCAATAQGEVLCWGRNHDARLGRPEAATTDPLCGSVPCSLTPIVVHGF